MGVRLLPLAIVAAGIIAYAGSFTGPFVFDDIHVIVNRPAIRSVCPFTWEARSVAELTFKINYAVGGLNVADYHATNLIIHILAGLLLYGVVRRTVRKGTERDGKGQKGSEGVALAVALIWTVHPLQTESVTYICQRGESLMGMFYLLCVYAWIRAQESGVRSQESGVRSQESEATIHHSRFTIHSVLWYGVAMAAFILGMGTKEVTVTVPVILLAYDRVFNRSATIRSLWRRRWVPVVLLAGFCLLLVPCYRAAMWTFGPDNDVIQRISPWSYLLTQAGVILHYLRLSIVPHPLCFDYGWPIARDIGSVLVPCIIVAALVVGALVAVVRRMPIGFLGTWFFVILAPTSSILPSDDAAFEHRMYLSLAAVVVLVVFGFHRLLMRVSRARPDASRAFGWLRAATLLCVVIVFTALTIKRNTTYESEYRMWLDVASKRRNNVRAEFGVISCLVARGDFAEAEQRARALVKRIENRDPGIADDTVRAASGNYYYPMVLSKLAQAIAGQGCLEEAIAQYKKALTVRLDDPSTYCNLAVTQYMAGKPEEAIASCREAIRVAPGYARGNAFLGFLLAEKGDYANAARSYETALASLPDLLTARYGLAWLLATCPDDSVRDGARAVGLARQICEAMRYESHRGMDLLAAALAEAGNFKEAVAAARRALELATRSGAVDVSPGEPGRAVTVPAIEERLKLYEEGKAFREERGEEREGE